MATNPSNLTRFQTSSPSTRVQPAFLVTAVTQRLKFPSRPPKPPSVAQFTLPKEPEDARLTGGTRSLDRRLLALNFSRPLVKQGVASERIVAPIGSAVA
jgi:hypothetical protein